MKDEILTSIRELLANLGVSHSGVKVETIAGQTVFTIESDDARAIIGPHGDTIHAIDFLIKKMHEKRHPRAPIGSEESLNEAQEQFLVDVNGYRAQRIRDIETKANMMAERAREFKYDVEMEPMSSYERLIVHSVLGGKPNIKTESQGEGRGRRIVIKYVA